MKIWVWSQQRKNSTRYKNQIKIELETSLLPEEQYENGKRRNTENILIYLSIFRKSVSRDIQTDNVNSNSTLKFTNKKSFWLVFDLIKSHFK